MTDSWMKGRVKGHRDGSPDGEQATDRPGVAQAEQAAQMDQPGRDVQRQALQMLTLAQRTGEEHVASAQRQADKVQAEARASAEQIVRDAQGQAEAIHREAEKALSDARARAAQIGTDAQAHANNARGQGDKIVAEAQARAAETARHAQASADGLERQAQLRYEEMVGNLAAKREALQQQIEALQEFDRDYRARLLAFMQAQLRALWVEEPHVDGEIDEAGVPATRPPLAQQPHSGTKTDLPPAQTSPADPSAQEATEVDPAASRDIVTASPASADSQPARPGA